MNTTSPRIRIVVDDTPVPPVVQPDVYHGPAIRTNTWGCDESKYNKDYASAGVPPICTVDRGEIATSQRRELMNVGGEAAKYVLSMYSACFEGDAPMHDRMYAVIDKTPAEIASADPTTINGLFHSKILIMEAAIVEILKDPAPPDDERRTAVLGAARGVITMLIRLNDMLISSTEAKRTMEMALSGKITSTKDALWRYMDVDSDCTPNEKQRLYKIAFDKAVKLQYARYKNSFMRRITVEGTGYMTNAWERVCTIQEFVYDLTSVPDGVVQFLTTRAPNIMEEVASMLSKKREHDLPWLKPDRRVFAFRNGCYMCKEEVFVEYTKAAPPTLPDGTTCPTACKYHDVVIDPRWLLCDDPMSIHTPLMDLIMDTQQLGQDVKRVYFGMLGRSIYDLGEMDNWQVFLFVKGAAETGKSTLLKFITSFYNMEDVGILSNNIEAKFGASMIADKFVVVGDDLGENFSLDQQLFQKMGSGDEVSLPVKNKDAIILKWITQLLLSGNVLPDYKDNSGSVSRRLVIVHYANPVKKVDPTIPERLKAEVGAAIVKCNRMYRNMVRRLASLLSHPTNPLTFWEAIPEEFRIQKRNTMELTNAVMGFLRSGSLVFGPSLYMTKSMFLAHMDMHCKTNGIPKPRFQPAQYEVPFVIMGLKMSSGKQTMKYPRTSDGRQVTDMWIHGCDLASSEAIAMATADSVRANDDALIAYAKDPTDVQRAADELMNGGRKRPHASTVITRGRIRVPPPIDDDGCNPPAPQLPRLA